MIPFPKNDVAVAARPFSFLCAGDGGLNVYVVTRLGRIYSNAIPWGNCPRRSPGGRARIDSTSSSKARLEPAEPELLE